MPLAVWDSRRNFFSLSLGMIFWYKLHAIELDSSNCRHILSSSCLGAARASCKRPRADVDGGGASRAASRGPGPPTEYGRQARLEARVLLVVPRLAVTPPALLHLSPSLRIWGIAFLSQGPAAVFLISCVSPIASASWQLLLTSASLPEPPFCRLR